MDTFNVGGSLKLQSYLNNQTLDNDTMDFLENVNFRQLMTREEFTDIYNKVQRYRVLEQENIANPSSDISKEMQELSQDVMYSTGSPIHSINMSKLKTNDDLEQAMLETNIRSKNDLFVDSDYSIELQIKNESSRKVSTDVAKFYQYSIDFYLHTYKAIGF